MTHKQPINAVNCEDDELAIAVFHWLVIGAGRPAPMVRGRPWESTREATQAEFARRFPRCMDREKKGGK